MSWDKGGGKWVPSLRKGAGFFALLGLSCQPGCSAVTSDLRRWENSRVWWFDSSRPWPERSTDSNRSRVQKALFYPISESGSESDRGLAGKGLTWGLWNLAFGLRMWSERIIELFGFEIFASCGASALLLDLLPRRLGLVLLPSLNALE